VSRIGPTFEALRAAGRPGLVTFVTAGDPTLARSAEVLLAADRGGADVLEVGVPFSEPLADGPVIQRATERALASGTTLAGVLDMVAGIRRQLRAPVVLFSYANPILRMGVETFADQAAKAGVDGVLMVDLPLEESGTCRAIYQARGIDTIFLLSPTTSDRRIRQAASLGSGFLYAISRLGVTGSRDALADGVEHIVARIRAATSLPIAVGFGISKPEHVREVGKWADAAVVGSALVNLIAEAGTSPDLPGRVEEYVRWLKG
jgi:tryptophan synthase alpha chain